MQQQNYKHQKFVFCNDKAKLIAASGTMLAYVREVAANAANADSVILRSQWILTELLTNAAKHSNDSNIIVEIHLKDRMLEIVKFDQGEPFSIFTNGEKRCFPADFDENCSYVIHKDDLSILHAIKYNETLTFKAEDVEMNEECVFQLNEHFGLIIIARSAEEFTYTYNCQTKTNIFKVQLELKTNP